MTLPASQMYLYGEEAGFPLVLVKYDWKIYDDFVNSISKTSARKVFGQVWPILKKTTMDDVAAWSEEGGQEWSDFCDDIAIFYACRFVLFGTPVPLASFRD